MTRDLLHALATDIKAALLWLPRRVGERWAAADSKLAGQSADVAWGRRP